MWYGLGYGTRKFLPMKFQEVHGDFCREILPIFGSVDGRVRKAYALAVRL